MRAMAGGAALTRPAKICCDNGGVVKLPSPCPLPERETGKKVPLTDFSGLLSLPFGKQENVKVSRFPDTFSQPVPSYLWGRVRLRGAGVLPLAHIKKAGPSTCLFKATCTIKSPHRPLRRCEYAPRAPRRKRKFCRRRFCRSGRCG